MNLRQSLALTIPRNEGHAAHFHGNYSSLGKKIVQLAPQSCGLHYGGAGERRGSDGALEEFKLDFFYKDLTIAIKVFRSAGLELGFPRGATLKHVTYDADQGSFDFKVLIEW
jgi:hypothetical protein